MFQSDFHEVYENVKTNLRISRYGCFISILSVRCKLCKRRSNSVFPTNFHKDYAMSKQTSASRAMAASSRILASAASCASCAANQCHMEDYGKDKTNLRISRYGGFISLLSVRSKLLRNLVFQSNFHEDYENVKQTCACRAMAASSLFLTSAASCAREASILESSACDFSAVICMSAICILRFCFYNGRI